MGNLLRIMMVGIVINLNYKRRQKITLIVLYSMVDWWVVTTEQFGSRYFNDILKYSLTLKYVTVHDPKVGYVKLISGPSPIWLKFGQIGYQGCRI